MVVSANTYAILNVAASIFLIARLVFSFVGKEKALVKIIRLICSFSLVVIFTVQIPIEMAMDKSYEKTIFLVIFCLICVVTDTFCITE